MNSIETIEYQLSSKRKSDIKKQQLVVDKEHDIMLEHFFRKDNEVDRDSNALAELCRRYTTIPK